MAKVMYTIIWNINELIYKEILYYLTNIINLLKQIYLTAKLMILFHTFFIILFF